MATDARTRLAMRVQAFAAAVAARHVYVAVSVRPIDLVLRRSAAPPPARTLAAATAWHLHLRFVSCLSPVTGPRRRERHATRRSASPLNLVHLAGAAPPGAAIVRLIERLHSRESRLEWRPAPEHARTEAPHLRNGLEREPRPAPRVPPLDFVVRRSPAPAPEAARVPARQEHHVEVHTGRSKGTDGWIAPARQPVIPLAPHELNRLADNVIRVLDRRVVAHRERVGGV
jgi:hypothetical protein